MSLDDPVDLASLAAGGLALAGLAAAAVYGLLRGRRAVRGGGVSSGTALARAGSYTGLALALAVAAQLGTIGIAGFVFAFVAIGLLEWSRLFDLPTHHRISLVVAAAVMVAAVATAGVDAAGWLVGGIVLVGAAWPVVRADTGRAVRDLGFAAVGFVVVAVLLAHGLALAVELDGPGVALFVALAVACAGSDVAAYVVGRRFGRALLAPTLSPSKTRAGVAGNVIGAAIGLVPLLPALVPPFGPLFVAALVPIVAAGSVWGDLLESAVKREAGVKDAGEWLPGFGGILDRVDSLLITVALAYWALRLLARP